MLTRLTSLAHVLLMACTLPAFSQNSAEDAEIVRSSDIQKPEFPGGDQALQEHIQKSLDPDLLNSIDQSGNVFVKFTIDKKGRTKNVAIVPERSSIQNDRVWAECKSVIS